MWGTEWGEEVFDSRGHFAGEYSSVKGAELDVAWSSRVLSSSRAMRTILLIPVLVWNMMRSACRFEILVDVDRTRVAFERHTMVR